MAPKKKVIKKILPVKVAENEVLVSGGYNRKPEPCPFRTATYDGAGIKFVRVEAREPWLIKGACGDKRITEGLTGRTTLVQSLREKLAQACDGEPTVLRCRGEAEDSRVSDDPMAQVAEDDVVRSELVAAKHSYRRSRYFANNVKNKVIEVSMPQRAPETGIDEGERMVRLYVENRMKVWLCTEDADWALAYLRDQLANKGVRRVAPDDRGPGDQDDLADDWLLS